MRIFFCTPYKKTPAMRIYRLHPRLHPLSRHSMFFSMRCLLAGLRVRGRALLASLFTVLLGVASGFSTVHRLAVGRGGEKSTCSRQPALRAFSESLFRELDRELTDADVRDLCWAVFSPSLLRPSCTVSATLPASHAQMLVRPMASIKLNSKPQRDRSTSQPDGSLLALLEGAEAGTVLCSDARLAAEFLRDSQADTQHLRAWLAGKRHRLGKRFEALIEYWLRFSPCRSPARGAGARRWGLQGKV